MVIESTNIFLFLAITILGYIFSKIKVAFFMPRFFESISSILQLLFLYPLDP